jgi:hypothetical protein
LAIALHSFRGLWHYRLLPIKHKWEYCSSFSSAASHSRCLLNVMAQLWRRLFHARPAAVLFAAPCCV